MTLKNQRWKDDDDLWLRLPSMVSVDLFMVVLMRQLTNPF